MDQFLKAVKITDKVYWVGVIDWNLRNFHGYITEAGSTYNAFLVIDEKITLIDTVKEPFYDQMMARIRSVIDPARIDYIVSDHSEMDHTGALPLAIRDIKPEKVFASPNGEKNLNAQLKLGMDVTVVKTGDSVSIGKNKLQFVQTQMLHWPDSMFTYLSDEKILFSQDAFGRHFACSKLFYDEHDRGQMEWEGEKYFANILMPYSKQLLKLLEELPGLNLDIDYIFPDHGPLLRRPEDIARTLELYRKWAEQKPLKRAIVIYDTMWHATERMTASIADGIRSTGVDTEEISVRHNNRSYVITQLSRSGAIVAGSSTLNNNLLPSMADVLTYLRGLKPKNKIGFAFGSSGWSGEAVNQVAAYLTETSVELVNDGVTCKYSPSPEVLQACFEAGRELGMQLISKVDSNSNQ
jgi:flavorubredoxin